MKSASPVLALPAAPAFDGPQDEPSVLYWVVYKALVGEIQADAQSVGKDLPIERLLSDHFGVSRFTVRQALDMLEKEGYIRKQRAKPARVISRTPGAPVARTLRSLSDVLRPGAIRATSVESYGTAAYAFAAELLNQSAATSLYVLRLAHQGEARQIGFSEIYFPPSVGAMLGREDFDHDGEQPLFVYPIVEARTGRRIDHAQITIGAEPAARAARTSLAPMLGDTPLICIQYVFFSQGEPVQLTINWLDSRVHRIRYELSV